MTLDPISISPEKSTMGGKCSPLLDEYGISKAILNDSIKLQNNENGVELQEVKKKKEKENSQDWAKSDQNAIVITHQI